MSMPLQRPEVFNNGTTVWIDNDLIDMLRYGYAPLGWEGDPNMNLWFDNVDNHIYLTSLDDEGNEYIIARKAATETIDSMHLIKMIVTHDRNRGYNLATDLDKNDATVIEKREIEDTEAIRDVGQKLAWAIKKDLA